MWRRPLLAVVNGSGRNLMGQLKGLWLEVKVTDRAGQESDKATILCLGPPGRFGIPKRDEEFEILMGWADEGLVTQGRFRFQTANARGAPEDGERIALDFKAADFVDDLKKSGRKHYDAGTTFGDLVRKEAKAAGLTALVDPVLDKLKLGYRLRWDQSAIDFINEVADDVGATIKPAGGKLVAMKRGGGTTGGGKALEPILIRRRRSFGYDVDIEPRPEAGHVAAAWQDEKSGRRRLTKVPTGRDGPIVILPHPYRSEIEAREAAKSQAYERGNNSGSGYFESPGLPRARAEAPVIATGFGGFIDGRWKAESVEKVITVQGAFTATVNIAAGDEKKGQKGK